MKPCLAALGLGLIACQAAARTYNVRDFGASGTGADDTTAIQNAINAATATTGHGETVLIPAGRYRLSRTLRIPARSQGVNLAGEGKTRTVLYRNTDYGDTLVVGDPASFAAENVSLTGLWFYHDYGGYENLQSPATMQWKPQTGAHLVAYGMTRGKVSDCQFWNMPCQLDFRGGAVTEVSHCTLRGSWDHAHPELQVTTENIKLRRSPLGQVPTDFRLVNNNLVGYLSPPRRVTYGTWSGDLSENAGPLAGIRILAGEVVQIQGGNIGGTNDSNLIIQATASIPLLNIFVSGVFFDSARQAGIKILNPDGAGNAYNVHINGNTFIGQENGDSAIWVGPEHAAMPPVAGLMIMGNLMLSLVKSPIVIHSGAGVTIRGNQIRDWNTRGGYLGDPRQASALYLAPAARLVSIQGNDLGGGNFLSHSAATSISATTAFPIPPLRPRS